MAVTIACAVSPPTPGMVASRRIAGSVLAVAMILRLEGGDRAVQPRRSGRAGRAVPGAAAPGSPRPRPRRARSARQIRAPPVRRRCRARRAWLRRQFINWVRCLTMSSRARSTPRAACWSTLLIATKRMSGPPQRGADRGRIARIGLVAPDKRLDISGRDQPHLVAERAQAAAPVMRRAAGLDPDQRRRQLGKKTSSP